VSLDKKSYEVLAENMSLFVDREIEVRKQFRNKLKQAYEQQGLKTHEAQDKATAAFIMLTDRDKVDESEY
jgi:hypothetical protein